MFKTFSEIVGAWKTVTETIDGIGLVDLQPYGKSPWAGTNAKEFHWWAECFQSRLQFVTNPGTPEVLTLRRFTLLVVEGWYPFESGVSEAAWRPMLDLKMAKLESRPTLGLAPLILEEGPLLVKDTTATKTSLAQGDLPRLCHYARIVIRYSEDFSVTTDLS